MTMTEAYLLAGLAGGGWAVQILLEREGKEQHAQIAQAVGYGAIVAIAYKMGLSVIDTIELFGLGWW